MLEVNSFRFVNRALLHPAPALLAESDVICDCPQLDTGERWIEARSRNRVADSLRNSRRVHFRLVLARA